MLMELEKLDSSQLEFLNEDWKSAIAKGLIAVTLMSSLYGTPAMASGKNPEKEKAKMKKMYKTYADGREKAGKPTASYEEWEKWYKTGENSTPQQVANLVQQAVQTKQDTVKMTETPSKTEAKKTADLSYSKFKNTFGETTQRSYEQWVASQISKKGAEKVINIDSAKFGKTDILLSKSEFTLKGESNKQSVVVVSKNDITPGNYLIKAKKQILTGVGLQLVGGVAGYLIVNSSKSIDPAKYPIEYGDSGYNITYESAVRSRTNLGIATGVVCGLVGFGLEISGIIHIGNAGVSLNANGIGVTIPIGK